MKLISKLRNKPLLIFIIAFVLCRILQILINNVLLEIVYLLNISIDDNLINCISSIIIFIIFVLKTKKYQLIKCRHLLEGLILICPSLIIVRINSLTLDVSLLNSDNVRHAFYLALSAGVVEETLMRIIPIASYMYLVDDIKKYRVCWLFSSLVFGLMHLTNIFYGADIVTTIGQVIAACGMGALYSAVFIRTSNPLPMIISHFLTDFVGLLTPELLDTNALLSTRISIVAIIIEAIMAIGFILIANYYLRTSKEATIKENWK